MSHDMLATSDYSEFVRFVRSGFQGQLIEPADKEYEAARAIFNSASTKHPAVIARCKTADDVVLAVRGAGLLGLNPAVRGGGHSVAGWSSCNGLVIDLSCLKEIGVNQQAGIAHVEAGLTWGELDRETARLGLAVPGGIISTTGIAGLTLGGGVGWLVRKYGLSCDNLVAAKLVTADGHSKHVSSSENADLFWAIRGGGGNFGIVTEFTYRLHPVAEVFGGRVVFDGDRGKSLLKHYRELPESISDDLTASIGFSKQVDGRPVISLIFCHLGQTQDLDQLQRVISDCGPQIESSARQRSFVSMQQLLDHSFPAGLRHYWRSYFLDRLDDEAIATLLEWSKSAPSLSSSVLLERYTGFASRVAAGATAFSHRNKPYNLHILACWQEQRDDDENTAWADGFWKALKPFSDGTVYGNFLGDEGATRVRAAYGNNYDRLVGVKQKHDPTNMFRLNNNIDPGPPPCVAAARKVQLGVK